MLNTFIDNYVLIVLMVSFMFFLYNHSKIGKKDISLMCLIMGIILLIVVFDKLEYKYSLLSEPTFLRTLFSVLCYSFKPLVVLLFIKLLEFPKDKMKYLYAIYGANVLVYVSSFFTDIAFTFDENNIFVRGILGYTAHFIAYFYILVSFIFLIKKFKVYRLSEIPYILFILISCIGASLLETFGLAKDILNVTMVIDAIFIYLFLYVHFTKLDVLTMLFNRQSFYEDMKLYNDKITGVMSIDMNGLKYINDTYGHMEGDKAISTVAHLFDNISTDNYRFYRIGGDEFTALCLNQDKKDIEKTISDLRNSMKQLDYSCSIGYFCRYNNESVKEMYKEADKFMYKEKDKYYKDKKKR